MFERFSFLISAGLFGGAAGLYINKSEVDGWFNRILFLLGGLGACIFLAPPISKYLGLIEPEQISGVGFAFACVWQLLITKIGGFISNFTIGGQR